VVLAIHQTTLRLYVKFTENEKNAYLC